jgi:cytochrome c oxidase assembly factor CtaG
MALLHADQPTVQDPLSLSTLVTEATIDPLAASVVLVAGALYATGVRRLGERDRRWRTRRTVSFFAGLGTIVVATQSGLAAYESSLFSAHVVQHVLIGMVAPFFLALGAPITLALQASPRRTQVTIVRGLRAGAVRVATHPLVGLALFALSLFALYFTPIYEASLGNEVVHELVHLHFFVAGSVFFWAVIGLDPVSHRIPHGWRVLLVMLTIPFHAFLGLAMMGGDRPIAADHYASIDRPTDASPMADQRTGAGIMWVMGDLIGFIAAGVVMTQWMAHESRRARRDDAIDDRQLQVST